MILYSKDYPFSLAKDIENLLLQVKAIQQENSSLIAVSEAENCIISLADVDKNSNYYLKVSNPTLNEQRKSYFSVEVYPSNSHSLKKIVNILTFEEVIAKIKWWISLIQNYNHITYTQVDAFEIIYEQEFIDAFEIIDEDADKVPFDLPRQLLLDSFLANVSTALEDHKDKYEVQELINETSQVRQEITVSTKKVLIKKISTLLAKIRLKGLELIKDVIKDYAKDIIKEGLKIFFEASLNYINKPH